MARYQNLYISPYHYIFMARFKKARRYISRQRAGYRRARRKHPGMTGITGNMFSGAVLGVGTVVAAPYINRYVPSVLGMAPVSVAMLGGGILAKGFLHKGGRIADSAITIGTYQLSAQLASGYMGGNTSSGGIASY